MNVHMYDNPVTQSNLLALKRQGHHVLEPATGLLACAYEGRGKYPPNEEVLYAIKCYTSYTRDLVGVKALVSAGATVEAIDPMRKITNNSSGKMGLALARALSLRGAEVQLVYGSVSQDVPYYLNEAIQATDVNSMRREMISRSADNHWIFSCAAVSDYVPEQVSEQKIKKAGDLLLNLKRSPDILQEIGQKRRSDQYLVGFAAETQDLMDNALTKLQQKNLDLIIANDLANAGKDTNRILIIDKQGLVDTLEGDKYVLAHLILDRVKARAK
jgi:phosphopantothenoylcysteine decarboxylase/phosphopantothenate--cysteine ligase